MWLQFVHFTVCYQIFTLNNKNNIFAAINKEEMLSLICIHSMNEKGKKITCEYIHFHSLSNWGKDKDKLFKNYFKKIG